MKQFVVAVVVLAVVALTQCSDAGLQKQGVVKTGSYRNNEQRISPNKAVAATVSTAERNLVKSSTPGLKNGIKQGHGFNTSNKSGISSTSLNSVVTSAAPAYIPKAVPVAVPRPVSVPVPKPYAVPVDKPYPVTVDQHVPVPFAQLIPVPQYKAVPVPVDEPYAVNVPQYIPVDIPTPVGLPEAQPVFTGVDTLGYGRQISSGLSQGVGTGLNNGAGNGFGYSFGAHDGTSYYLTTNQQNIQDQVAQPAFKSGDTFGTTKYGTQVNAGHGVNTALNNNPTTEFGQGHNGGHEGTLYINPQNSQNLGVSYYINTSPQKGGQEFFSQSGIGPGSYVYGTPFSYGSVGTGSETYIDRHGRYLNSGSSNSGTGLSLESSPAGYLNGQYLFLNGNVHGTSLVGSYGKELDVYSGSGSVNDVQSTSFGINSNEHGGYYSGYGNGNDLTYGPESVKDSYHLSLNSGFATNNGNNGQSASSGLITSEHKNSQNSVAYIAEQPLLHSGFFNNQHSIGAGLNTGNPEITLGAKSPGGVSVQNSRHTFPSGLNKYTGLSTNEHSGFESAYLKRKDNVILGSGVANSAPAIFTETALSNSKNAVSSGSGPSGNKHETFISYSGWRGIPSRSNTVHEASLNSFHEALKNKSTLDVTDSFAGKQNIFSGSLSSGRGKNALVDNLSTQGVHSSGGHY